MNHSYEAVSVSDICKAIGFTKGALYHHFKNKEELFRLVVDKYLFIPEVIADVEKSSLSEYIQICITQSEKIIKNLFCLSLIYIPINYMSMFADAFRHYPGYAELKGAFIEHEIEKTKIILENAIKSGEIRDDINTTLVATNFFSISMGLAGDLVRNNSIDDAISLLKEQTSEFYKLLKR